MPVIKYQNEIIYNNKKPIKLIDIAKIINMSKLCIAGKINGKFVNYDENIFMNSNINIISMNDFESIKIVCQSCIYLLGYVIKKLWPQAKLISGKTIENTFYYDIDLEYRIKEEDIKKISDLMKKITKKKNNIIKKQISYNNAYNLFSLNKEIYKIDLIKKKFNQNLFIDFYYLKEYFDILKGPIVPNTKFCNYFKINKISGIFCKNTENNKNLQRIYGIAHNNKQNLINYLNLLKEAEKRDHRKINKKLDLYHIQDESPGMIFWHNNGYIIFREIENFILKLIKKNKYQEVKTPLIINTILWEKTGHLKYYNDSMFTLSSEKHNYCVKPMNCPGHVQIFNQKIKSYRDLPLRIAEFGSCHRNESSGSLHGLIRAKSFTQDDAHIFCTENQIYDEIICCIKMILDVYKTFGFKNIKVKLSTRPIKKIGNDEIWNKSESILINALKTQNIKFDLQPGEGAFYGPKIEFILCDSLNRTWQCGTIQLDFSLPVALNAFYFDKNNIKKHPVMIHRAILGSIERFIGILIEEYYGFLPTWLSPIQIVILNISDKHIEYANNIKNIFEKIGLRIKTDLKNEKINFKIREYTLLKVPYMIICGDKEVELQKISVRSYDGKNFNCIEIESFIKKINTEINNKYLHNLEE